MRTLGAAEQLQSGQYLRMQHRRRPCLLYDNLEQRGFVHVTRKGEQAAVEVFIWRHADPIAEQAVYTLIDKLDHG